ncbi:MAG: CaiB/BaiF CoA-transferase family protein [Pseudohongiellaceae bacterium]
MTAKPPLDGIRVVALEHAIAAPLCTRQLAELGATVVKIERRETGDFARAYDQRVKGQCSHFVWTNRGKQSLSLDLKHPLATEVLARLLKDCDVLVQNLAPGATAKLGLDYVALKTEYPRLIVCDISGYGSKGPYKDRKAYDLLVQSEAGFLSVTGTADQPAKAGISIADIAAAMQAFSAILAALIQRGKTGRGSHIEISLLESMVEWMGYPLYYAYDGNPPPLRSGTDHASIYPYGTFSAGTDQQIMLGLQNKREWMDFCRIVLGQPRLATDSRFATNVLRTEARETLKAIIEDVFRHISIQELQQRLESARIAYARVNTMAEVWAHPQLEALRRRVAINTPAGKVDAFLPPGNNDSYPLLMGDVPGLGEHNRQVLQDAGYSADEIEQFSADKLI